MCTICPSCFNENIPGELAAKYGILFNAFVCSGYPLSYALGFILPTEEDKLKEDERWRIILFMPALISIL